MSGHRPADLDTLHLIYKAFGLTMLDIDKLSEKEVRNLIRYVHEAKTEVTTNGT